MFSNAFGYHSGLWVSWEDPRAKSQKLQLSVLKVWKKVWLFYVSQVLQNNQIATSRDNIKDLRLLERICYFKNRLTYRNNISKAIHLCIYCQMKKLFWFCLINKCSNWCVNKIYKTAHLGNEVKPSLKCYAAIK